MHTVGVESQKQNFRKLLQFPLCETYTKRQIREHFIDKNENRPASVYNAKRLHMLMF